MTAPEQPPIRYEGLAGLLMFLAVIFTIVFGGAIVRLAPQAPPFTPRPIVARAIVPAVVGVPARITAGEITIERTLPVASFALDEHSSLDAAVPPGPFTVALEVPSPRASGAVYIGAVIRDGSVIVRRHGEVLLSDAAESEPRLAKMSLPRRLGSRERLAVEFRAIGPRPALRMLWQEEGASTMLPWPAGTSTHVPDAALRGLVLAQERQCARCHAVEGAALRERLARHPAPDLSRAGARLRPEWVRSWLQQPARVKPGTAMPSLGHIIDDDPEMLEDLVHFVASLGGPFARDAAEETGAADDALRATGLVAYHEVGCFACHGPLEPLEALPGGRGSSGPAWRRYRDLPEMGAKTGVAQLAAFLRDPVAARPSGAMPAMALTNLEAHAIATYLVDRSAAAPAPGFTLDPARVRAGREAFAAQGCASCHALDGVEAAPTAAAALRTLDAEWGCLAPEARPGTPHFDLDDGQREDLAAFLASIDAWQSPAAPIDELTAELRRLNCLACHRRRTVAGVGGPERAIERYFVGDEHADLGDEGRLPPDLTDAGARLTTSWMRSVLVDGERARPYLGARMPEFGSAVRGLPDRFAACDGATEYQDRGVPAFSTEAARRGREIVGAENLNCISCHAIAGHASTGMPGPDLALMPGRLHYAYFRRWVSDPSRLRPGTRMPSFYVGVDAGDEIGAIWSYLSQGEQLPMPDGMEGPGGLELVVGERPVVLRTFMAAAGAYAIACGYPEQIHCVYDAERGTVTAAWEGRFLSAAGAWANRGGSETNPDDTDWRGPPGPVFRVRGASAAETTVRFGGYRLDAHGAPTFTCRLVAPSMTVTVTERPEPGGHGTRRLVRAITLSGPAGTTIDIVPGRGVAVRGAQASGDGQWSIALGDEPIEIELEVTW